MKEKFTITEDLFLLKVKAESKQVSFLFKLLKARNSNNSISHNVVPSLNSHKKFVLSYPYRCWFIIQKSNKPIGSVYLTKLNEIAIHFLSHKDMVLYKLVLLFILNTFNPLRGVPSVRSDFFIINLPINNNITSKLIKKLGGKKIQETYRF